MPYIPGSRYDVFVSYAREYNLSGDVTRFVDELSQLLTRHLGRGFQSSQIFFDRTQLHVTNAAWLRTLQEAASGSALLMPLLSPGYRDSPHCHYELNWFRSGQAQRGGPTSGLCPVLWWQTPLKDFAADLQAAQAHSFVGAFGQPFKPGSPEWDASLADFALKLAAALQDQRRRCGGVFVGYAPPDVASLRQKVVDEILQSGYRTLNETEIPEAKLALHFLGGQHLDHLNQVEQSLLLCPGETIVFVPPQTSLLAEESEFLAEVEDDLQAGRRLAGKRYHRLENSTPTQLVDYLRDCLSKVREADRPPTVAIPCEKTDVEAALLLASHIEASGIHAVCPDFLLYETSIATRIAKYRDLFLRSEALLYYWAKADPKAIASLRARARESSRAFRAEAWFIAPPDSPEKEMMPSGQIIRQTGDKLGPETAQALAAFLSSIQGRAAAP
jgi:hypothetical protein